MRDSKTGGKEEGEDQEWFLAGWEETLWRGRSRKGKRLKRIKCCNSNLFPNRFMIRNSRCNPSCYISVFPYTITHTFLIFSASSCSLPNLRACNGCTEKLIVSHSMSLYLHTCNFFTAFRSAFFTFCHPRVFPATDMLSLSLIIPFLLLWESLI